MTPRARRLRTVPTQSWATLAAMANAPGAMRAASFALCCCTALVAAPSATGGQSLVRIIDVDGRAMRVWTAETERRTAGQPVVVLEAGAREGLDTWRSVFARLAQVAPVITILILRTLVYGPSTIRSQA